MHVEPAESPWMTGPIEADAIEPIDIGEGGAKRSNLNKLSGVCVTNQIIVLYNCALE